MIRLKFTGSKKQLAVLTAIAVSIAGCIVTGCGVGKFSFSGPGFPFVEWEYDHESHSDSMPQEDVIPEIPIDNSESEL